MKTQPACLYISLKSRDTGWVLEPAQGQDIHVVVHQKPFIGKCLARDSMGACYKQGTVFLLILHGVTAG